MTVDEHVMNQYFLSNQATGQFHKLFDSVQPFLPHPSDILLQPKRYPFQLNNLPVGIQPWKSANGNPQTDLPYLQNPVQFQSLKYFPPPPLPSSLEMLNNYFHRPSPDMLKYIEKIREDEASTKMKDAPEVKLCEEDLWKQFNGLTTEMVITKSGRRMFPAFKVQLSGLDPKAKYVLALEMMPCDDSRFKFHNGKWTLAGKADPESNRLFYLHCESPATGESWMQKAVWFNKVKLTNNPTDKDPQHLVLNSMHKYVIQMHIFRADETSKIRFCVYPEIFVFNMTEFIAVTAYQNDKITQLKIDNNPFAKGFRDNGSGRREKKRLKYQHTITSTSGDSPAQLDKDGALKSEETTDRDVPNFLDHASKNSHQITSHSSRESTCSSLDRDPHSPVNHARFLKRKFCTETGDHDIPLKKCAGAIDSSGDRFVHRRPYTVHYTPHRHFPPTMDLADPIGSKLTDRPHGPITQGWPNWPMARMDSSYPLHVMSKLCRLMGQYKDQQAQHASNEALIQSVGAILAGTDQKEASPQMVPSWSGRLERPSQAKDTLHSNAAQRPPTHINDRTPSSSTFNISNLLL